MASIPATRICRLTLQYCSSGNRLSSVMHYYASSAIVGQEIDDFLDAWLTAVQSLWLDVWSHEIVLQAVLGHCVAPETALPGVQYINGPLGNIVEESLPANTAAVLQLRQTEISGRHNGRIFISGLPETATADGLITTAFATTELAALAAGLDTPIVVAGQTWKLCVLQRYDAGAPVSPPVGWDVSLVRVTRNLATQRRRTTELREFHP